jgi:hypothetical protein
MISRIENVALRRAVMVGVFLPFLVFGIVFYGLCGATAFVVAFAASTRRVWSAAHY